MTECSVPHTLCARHVKWSLVLDLQSSLRSLTHATDTGRYRLVIKYNLLRHSSHRLVVRDSCENLKDSYRLVVNLIAVPTQLSQTSSVGGKGVYDCLLYDDSFLDHYGQVRRTLLCAREHGITLSAKKLEFAVPEVEFCGYRVDSDGRVVDATKTTAIRDVPVPTNRTDLRSFLGLVNQCSELSPWLSECTSPLRGLLKTSNEFCLQ